MQRMGSIKAFAYFWPLLFISAFKLYSTVGYKGLPKNWIFPFKHTFCTYLFGYINPIVWDSYVVFPDSCILQFKA